MNKLYFFFLAISVSLHSFVLSSEPPQQKQDVSYCALRLFEAARHTSDQQASKDMLQIIAECKKKGLPKQTQFMNAHQLAVDKKDHLVSWRLAAESGRQERNYTYHAYTALWTITSATAAVGTCWYTGLCGGKK